MRDLAKGDDLITLFLQIGGQLADRRIGAVVVRLRAVARGHHPGQQRGAARRAGGRSDERSEEHTSELQSLMRISYAVFCLKQKTASNYIIQHSSRKNNL